MIQKLIQHRQLLQMEYEYTRQQYQQQTENIGLRQKVNAGVCWFPVHTGKCGFNSLNQRTLEISCPDCIGMEHKFEPGKPVCFFTEDASQMLHFLPYVCKINYVEEGRMVVEVPDERTTQTLLQQERMGVQLYFDEYTFRLMFNALDSVIQAKKNRLSELRDIFHTSAPLHKHTSLPVAFPWLNSSQESAINEIIAARDVAIVHGPPGTGKTTTLVEAIYETLRRETQVMVCAPSNMAVDWIAEQLIQRGIPVLRIGNPIRVGTNLLSHTYEYQFEAHSLYPQLWGIRKTIRELYTAPHIKRDKIDRLKERVAELESTIHQDLMQEARVIACTLTGSGSHLLVGCQFRTVFIDEAAQALEAACWIPLLRAQRVIMAGDHCQLPPTIKCPQVLKAQPLLTLMEQVAQQKPAAVHMLKVQYRMHNDIMQFSNNIFYQGLLTSHPSVMHRSILDWDTPIEWINTPDEVEYTERRIPDAQSRQNLAEAKLTLDTIKNYFNRIGHERIQDERLDTGIISPYKGQVRLIRKLLHQDASWKPFKKRITIDTIDGFQGQERDIIVISLVRSNEFGDIGFLQELRRMNVALTRARMKLIIIGNKSTLCKHPFYQKLASYIQKINREES